MQNAICDDGGVVVAPMQPVTEVLSIHIVNALYRVLACKCSAETFYIASDVCVEHFAFTNLSAALRNKLLPSVDSVLTHLAFYAHLLIWTVKLRRVSNQAPRQPLQI